MNGAETVQDEARDTNDSQVAPSTCTVPQQQVADKHKRCIQREAQELEQNRAALEHRLEKLQLAVTAALSADTPRASPHAARSSAASCAAPAAQHAVSDVVTLNVGGKLFSCQRQTLCLVKESLLELMFSGRWPDHGSRDTEGNIFLDLDPALFEVVLNWLRRFNMYRGGNVPEPRVPEDKLVHMLAMLDYLQLHRHIPITYQETFDAQHCSPFIMVQGATATRTAVAAQHKGKHTAPLKSTLMQYAVTDMEHSYFDMHVDVTLEVARFRESVESSSKAQYMFIGFMHRSAAVAVLNPAGDINTQLTKSPSCYGWLVGGKGSYTIRSGTKSQHSCTEDSLLWRQGDQLTLTLDTRRDRNCACISILNTATGAQKSLDAERVIGQSSSDNSSRSNPAEPDQQGQEASNNSRKARLGRRHRIPKALYNSPGGLHRQEIMAILDRQPGDANERLAQLVEGAALQVLEAQGLAVQAAWEILAQPGLIQRLVHQVRHVQQIVRDNVPAANGHQQDQPDADGGVNNAVTAASNGVVAADAGQSDALTVDASSAKADKYSQQDGCVVLSNGVVLPKSTAEYEWVLVVGMVQPKDSLRLTAVKRRGQRPSEQ